MRVRLPLLLGLAVLVAGATLAGRGQGGLETVRTTGGLVSGAAVAAPGVRVFKGVPFAAPPVGDLRWKPPAPVVPWQGVRKADAFSAACVQDTPRSRLPWTEEFMVQEQVSEDCLYLNVWTGASTPTERRPVLVFVHGGAFREGSGAVAVYDGTALAAKGLVVVTINYRLGAFGFLAHPALAAESPQHASGNYGLLDVIAALAWVKANAAAFGGDPARVTVSGQSAGAFTVTALTASPLARGLFHRAIVQSGSGLTGVPPLPAIQATQAGERFAQSLNAASAAALRAAPATDVLKAALAAQGLSFRPVIDGWSLVDAIPAVFAKGEQNDVPILTGYTADEGSSGADYGRLARETFVKQIESRYESLAPRFLELYPAGTDEQAKVAQVSSARDRVLASLHLWSVQRAASPATKTKAFTYFLTRGIPWPEHPEFAAFHSSDLPYVFGTLDKLPRPWTKVDRDLSSTLMAYWTNFVTTGDPNGAGLPPFPPADPAQARVMELGATVGARPSMDATRLAFWKEYFASPMAQRAGPF